MVGWMDGWIDGSSKNVKSFLYGRFFFVQITHILLSRKNAGNFPKDRLAHVLGMTNDPWLK